MAITPTEKIWMNGELVAWADANVHILTHTLHYGMGVFEGVAEIRAFFEDWWGTWGDHSIEVEELAVLANGVMFACVREDSRLAGSAGHLSQRRGWVTLWAHDKIERVTVYLDIDAAHADAERLASERA